MNPRRMAVALALGLAAGTAQAQTLTEWVQSNPGSQAGRIALGYPVPIPVDTSLPFDGFRSYAGLHARHQDLAATTPWVHPAAVGTTRLGRTVWAYRLGDGDLLTPWGLPEAATLTNGGIHAREWQTPETVTGILELIATQPADHHYYDYLREQVNAVVIPVLNIDGFLQTQRYPAHNWLGSDPDDPQFSPRDGRMRRKNLNNADEQLNTLNDHLNGVDLNRNNAPFWNTTNQQRSSSNVQSLVHHGSAPGSEPEVQALDAAAALGPASQLRLYTDVHSFAQVHFWVRNSNDRLANQTQQVLNLFSEHHRVLPGGKRYVFETANLVPRDVGMGTTDEYFTHQYQVPAWTLETEPSGGQAFHAPLPGGGADYGGAGVNGHDGFILPESQIRRVRDNLAQSFAAVIYRQSGPPNVQAVRIVDAETSAVVMEATWDPLDATHRTLFQRQHRPLQLGREYRLWAGFNKPMRWLDAGGAVTTFPGVSDGFNNVAADLAVAGSALQMEPAEIGWATMAGGAPDGYHLYRTDALAGRLQLQDSPANIAAVGAGTEATLRLYTRDMTAMGVDANPATVASWQDGRWVGYENEQGQEVDFGGRDVTLRVQVTAGAAEAPFTVQPGIAASWYDRDRSGEGFVLQVLPDARAVLFWFTYDDAGGQDWYLAIGAVRGNRLVFPEVRRYSGGVFGPGFDTALVSSEVMGSARFSFTGCDEGYMDWHLGNRRGRQELARLSRIMGLDCGLQMGPPETAAAAWSGAWYDPSHSGEGYVLEVLADGRPLVYWFSYGPDGARRWFTGVGVQADDGRLVFDNLITTRGGVFGEGFDPGEVERPRWGSLTLDLDCSGGTASWDSQEAGFAPGTLDLTKLTDLDGPNCRP